MKAAIAKGGAGIGAIEIRELPEPVPGPGEALVRLRAATLNYRDLLFIKGLLPGLTKEPEFVPLSCAAGEVVALGENVTRVKPGDRVNPLFGQGWIDGPPNVSGMLGGLIDGVARPLATFDAESLCLLPDALGDLDAATLPCAGLTAWSALFGENHLEAGQWILVQGTGGVSIAALQWAKAAGAHVAIISSSDSKLTRARALGADLTVNYRATPDWAAAVKQKLGGKRVDIVVDVIGRGSVAASASLLNEGGTIAAIGLLDGNSSWDRTEVDGKPIVAVHVGNRARHEAMLAFAAHHGIRPVVDAVYDHHRLPDALRHLESQSFFGKIGLNLL
jgi:NADPH:quinone reductase-like Zn-dependent oxidoreductase